MIGRQKSDVEIQQIKRTLSKHDGMHADHSSRIDEIEQDVGDLQNKQCPRISRKILRNAKHFAPALITFLCIVFALIFGSDKAVDIARAFIH